MARKLRIQYPGAIYHVMNRGDRREAIFTDDTDRQLLMDTLEEACRKTERQESAPAKAERMVQEELTKLHWTVQELEVRRKGNPLKVRVALRLRSETTVTLTWIAARLHMGAPSHLACLLNRVKHSTASNQTSENTLF